MPWSGGTEIGAVYKDNEQVGPGFTLTAQRRNLFGGGEVFAGEITGSYEWFIGNRGNQGSMPNSFELGTKLSYSIPRLPFPRLWHANPDNPVSSKYSVSADWQRRGGFFEMVKTSAAMEYSFSRGKKHSFTFTPLRLTYMQKVHTTARFDSIVKRSLALENSLENQFIPQMIFSWTYDNASTRQNKRSQQYLRLTIAEAGGLVDLFAGWWGTHKKQGERQLWNQRFSQFVKFTGEFRNTYHISPKQSLVFRALAGMGYNYGNSASTEMPYSEQFYIGGANSLRGFAARTVGPGSVKLSFLEDFIDIGNIRLFCVGDYKLETNVEYRFPLFGSLNGAFFVDAGNIWNFKTIDKEEEDSELYQIFKDYVCDYMKGNPLKQLAVDCGAGLRLDLGMLVVRFDVGVPLHDPNQMGDHYFNCREGFFKQLGYNLAVGYPF
ncbi:MAG: BamA/TamA family outer membrane protein [Prevotellaceae bacterium]|nr:BamA/TamA family outer membrane protein [Prevotellaceae bacterium]